MIKNIMYVILSYFICCVIFTPIFIKHGRKKYLKDKGVRYKRINDLNNDNVFEKKVFKYTVFFNVETKKKLENINLLEIALNSLPRDVIFIDGDLYLKVGNCTTSSFNIYYTVICLKYKEGTGMVI